MYGFYHWIMTSIHTFSKTLLRKKSALQNIYLKLILQIRS